MYAWRGGGARSGHGSIVRLLLGALALTDLRSRCQCFSRGLSHFNGPYSPKFGPDRDLGLIWGLGWGLVVLRCMTFTSMGFKAFKGLQPEAMNGEGKTDRCH